MSRVLLAGESWTTTSIHTKGFDSFVTVEYQEGAGPLLDALTAAGHDVTYMPNQLAGREFPFTLEELAGWDVVLLSDIGANTLLIPPDTFSTGQRRPNRLATLRDWVRAGGGLGMIGGYLSFQGIESKANYRSTLLAEVLPIEMESGDDRQECPEGAVPRRVERHPIVADLDGEWPAVLGFQRARPRQSSRVLARVEDWPLLVVGTWGSGRTAAFMTDIGPHWAPEEFTAWPGFGRLWDRIVAWLGGQARSAEPEDRSDHAEVPAA